MSAYDDVAASSRPVDPAPIIEALTTTKTEEATPNTWLPQTLSSSDGGDAA